MRSQGHRSANRQTEGSHLLLQELYSRWAKELDLSPQRPLLIPCGGQAGFKENEAPKNLASVVKFRARPSTSIAIRRTNVVVRTSDIFITAAIAVARSMLGPREFTMPMPARTQMAHSPLWPSRSPLPISDRTPLFRTNHGPPPSRELFTTITIRAPTLIHKRRLCLGNLNNPCSILSRGTYYFRTTLHDSRVGRAHFA